MRQLLLASLFAVLLIAGCDSSAAVKDTGKPLPPSKVFKSKDGKKNLAGDELPPPPKR